MAYLSLRYCEKVSKLMQAGILKVVIGAIKMSMTFLFFAFYFHEYSPAKSSPDPRDHYPPTWRITPQP